MNSGAEEAFSHMLKVLSTPAAFPQGYLILSFPSILACFAGEFQGMFAVFAGFACKNSKHTPFVSAAGAKRAEKEIAL